MAPPTTAYHQAPPSTSALLSQDQIDDLIKRGDEEFNNDNYSAAKDYYYQAMTSQANPGPYILSAYALTISQLGNFDNAQAILKMAQKKYPGDKTIERSIQLSYRILEEQKERKRQLELERERERQEQLEFELEMAREKNRQWAEVANTIQDAGDALYDAAIKANPGHKQTQKEKDALKAREIRRQTEKIVSVLNSEDEEAIIGLLGEMALKEAQKDKKTQKLFTALTTLNQIAQNYEKIQNAAENIDSPSDVVNEKNMITFMKLLGEMSQNEQNNEKLNKTLKTLNQIARDYEKLQKLQKAAGNINSADEVLTEQNLITVLNSLNEMAQEYQKKRGR